jgi:tripartite-type tricarboxylate transporter receptor subunit TctC
MPQATADRLAREIAAVMAVKDVRDRFVAAKTEPVSADRDATRRMLAAFEAQWVPVIRQAGLQFE